MIGLGLSLVHAFHLICVNVASAGPLVCVWLDWRAGRGDLLARQTARFLAASSICLLLIGGGLGVVLAWLLWNQAFHDLMHAFSYKIIWGAWELLFSVILMSLYAVVVAIGPARRISWRLVRAFVAVLAATNLLYHFPILFIVMTGVSAGHLEQPDKVDAETFRQLMVEGSVIAQTVHFWLASVAVTGITLVAYGRWLQGTEESRTDGGRVASWGARIALVPTLLQILVGGWLLVVLPARVQQNLVGDDLVAAGLLVLSLLATLWLMHKLAAVAMGDTQPKSLTVVTLLMLSVIVLMTMTSRRALSPLNKSADANSEIQRGS